MIRSSLAGLGLAAVIAGPVCAQGTCESPVTATHTKDAVVIDATTRHVLMVVCPDGDGELSDPAYNAAGTAQVIVAHDPRRDQIAQAIDADPTVMGPAQIQAALTASAASSVSSSLSACQVDVSCSASTSAAMASASLAMAARR
jgi:hypothetical protein